MPFHLAVIRDERRGHGGETIWGTHDAFLHRQRLLDSIPICLVLLCIFQWIMIAPHELAHALAAKFLRYGQIRILIGSGKSICAFEFLGFRWLINLIPFGGLTLANPSGVKGLRWKQLTFIAAGPVLNAASALAAWSWMDPGGLADHIGSLSRIFFWANVAVLLENMMPWVVQTPFGVIQTDGMLLWNTLSTGTKTRDANRSRRREFDRFGFVS